MARLMRFIECHAHGFAWACFGLCMPCRLYITSQSCEHGKGTAPRMFRRTRAISMLTCPRKAVGMAPRLVLLRCAIPMFPCPRKAVHRVPCPRLCVGMVLPMISISTLFPAPLQAVYRVPCPRLCVGMVRHIMRGISTLHAHFKPCIGCHAHGFAWAWFGQMCAIPLFTCPREAVGMPPGAGSCSCMPFCCPHAHAKPWAWHPAWFDPCWYLDSPCPRQAVYRVPCPRLCVGMVLPMSRISTLFLPHSSPCIGCYVHGFAWAWFGQMCAIPLLTCPRKAVGMAPGVAHSEVRKAAATSLLHQNVASAIIGLRAQRAVRRMNQGRSKYYTYVQ